MKDIDKPVRTGESPDIVIIAHQWWWEMQYPEYNFTTANELHIPVRQNLLMRVESADVIHDWWVPALGRKIDAIPGRSNYTWIDASEPGEYNGACSEYCGTQHAGMRILVIAQLKEEFDRWVKGSAENTPATDRQSRTKRNEIISGKNMCKLSLNCRDRCQITYRTGSDSYCNKKDTDQR